MIGSGPGGYTAAFRAADLGLDVVLVERFDVLGGICLNVGCIPSKALLHAAEVIGAAEDAAGFGVSFGEPEIDLDRLREWKDEVVGKLTGGLAGLSKQRKVRVVTGEAKFTGPNEIDVDGTAIDFTHCIIAAGSRPIELPGFPDDERVIDSTGALEIADVPERLLVVGGGIIGLEMATVYDALGSKVSVVEMTPQLVPGCDPDLVKPLQARIEPRYEAIMLETKVERGEGDREGARGQLRGRRRARRAGLRPDPRRRRAPRQRRPARARPERRRGRRRRHDRGRRPAAHQRSAHLRDRRRHRRPDARPQGDLRRRRRGRGDRRRGRPLRRPEHPLGRLHRPRDRLDRADRDRGQAKTGLDYEVAKFNWGASAPGARHRAAPTGVTKLLVDPESRRILGAGITGVNAGELIAELVLAIELGANATDVGLTIHPHPTLSETVTFAAEVAEGTVTDIYAPKRKRKAKKR